MRKVLFVVVALAITAFACSKSKIKADDEGPIIVKNGSMTVDTTDNTGKWSEDQGEWSQETTGKTHHGDLWVLVIYNDGTFCPAVGTPAQPAPKQGTPVKIEYSESNFNPMFKLNGNRDKTRVSKQDLAKESDQRLRHGQQGDGGYITHVKDLDCDITKENLNQIKICSSESTCKDAHPVQLK